jgi:hypothetical protein
MRAVAMNGLSRRSLAGRAALTLLLVSLFLAWLGPALH